MDTSARRRQSAPRDAALASHGQLGEERARARGEPRRPVGQEAQGQGRAATANHQPRLRDPAQPPGRRLPRRRRHAARQRSPARDARGPRRGPRGLPAR